MLDQLGGSRISYLSGGPGEGKSTLAYHSARELSGVGYAVYELVGSALDGFSREYIRDELLAQADRLRGRARLIIVDDAQLLEWPDDVKETLLTVLKDDDTALVWVWTDDPDQFTDRQPEDTSIRINYANLAAKQAAFFEENLRTGKLSISQAALEEAENLSSEGRISTAWQYSFVAYGGSQRLAAGLTSLTNLELFVLFQLSARAIATGTLGLPVPTAQSILEATTIGWVRDDVRNQSYRQILYELSHRTLGRGQFLRIDALNASSPEIACLHYNFAREVVRETLHRTAVAADLVKGLKAILSECEKEDFRYFAVLCSDIGPYLGTFIVAEPDFVVHYIYTSSTYLTAAAEVLDILAQNRSDSSVRDFLEGLDGGRIAVRINSSGAAGFAGSASVIRHLRTVIPLYQSLVNSLDINALASAAGTVQPAQFQGLADLLRELGTRRAEMLASLDISQLASAAGTVQPAQFQGLADLLRELGTRRAEMLASLDISQLASAAGTVQPAQFQGLADLLRELGTRRAEMLASLDISQLASAANSARPSELGLITELLRAMGEYRGKLTDSLDIRALGATGSSATSTEFGSLARFLQGLGNRLAELLDHLDVPGLIIKANDASAADLRRVADLLWEFGRHRRRLFDSAILPHLDLSKLAAVASQANAAQFSHVAHLIRRLGSQRNMLLEHFDITQMAGNASHARPGEFAAVAFLLRQLGERRGQLVAALDLEELAVTASHARAGEFAAVAFLLRELGERRAELVAALDLEELAVTASHARPRDFDAVAELLRELGEHRAELVAALDLEELAVAASHARAGDLRGTAVLLQELGERRAELVAAIDLEELAVTASHARAGELRGVADMQREMGERLAEFLEARAVAERRPRPESTARPSPN